MAAPLVAPVGAEAIEAHVGDGLGGGVVHHGGLMMMGQRDVLLELWLCLMVNGSGLSVDCSWSCSWSGIGWLIDIVAYAGVLLVHLGVGCGQRLGIMRDGAIEVPQHILLGVGDGDGRRIASVANETSPGG